MTSDTYHTIERKAIDVLGPLGSLYDASNDILINNRPVEASKVQKINRCSVCELLPVDQSIDLISYLKMMDFNDALRQSILFRMIDISGTGCLIDYNQSINRNTRLMYYSYVSKEEELIFRPGRADEIVLPPTNVTRATHMITKILSGFEFLCVISIPDYLDSGTIDELLRHICSRLKENRSDFDLTDNEKKYLAQLINVTIYGSETCIKNPNTSLVTVLTSLSSWQRENNFHGPLKYTMNSLEYLYNSNEFSTKYYITDQRNHDIAKLQNTIQPLNISIKNIQRLFERIPKRFSNSVLNEQWVHYEEEFYTLLDIFVTFRNRLRVILIRIRQNLSESREIHQVISDQKYSSLETNLQMLYQTVYQWFTRMDLTERLKSSHIEYMNVSNLLPHQGTLMTIENIDAAVKSSLTKKDTIVIAWYSSDQLKQTQNDKWEQIYERLFFERKQTTERILVIYVDFSPCQHILPDFIVIKLPMLSTSSPPVQQSPPRRTEINVLLLGETGVGKSTFINAFVNYLIFDTLQQAQQNQPVVLIPVSFLTTVGDKFDEVDVKFGEVDSNENFEHEGQSVTQQCKSYIFDLSDKLRLRLIDTPGMGDTRGVDQDDKNIHHILTYTNNLSHLNAVCLLLKPNTSRLTVFFRSCINQLFTYLTPIGYSNIIFCFTNARATFYAPGDSGPLLRQMLKKEYQDDIPFEKMNTFCFDSESFRYLAARKCDVEFDEFQKQECMNSWTTSVIESVRLLKYILTREPYYVNEWQSSRKAALDILVLARPLMETLRLIIYNLILCEKNIHNNQIILHSDPVKVEMCSSCASSCVKQVGPFFIVQYQGIPPKINTIQHHQCSLNSKTFLMESIVQYKFVVESQNRTHDRLRDSFNDILFKCDKLTHFLRQQKCSVQDDPFQPILERFLAEEQQISQNSNINSDMNRRVYELLKSIENIRLKNSIQLNESKEEPRLNEICEIIAELSAYDAVEKQFKSILERRRQKMKTYEYRVETDLVKNKRFTELI